MDEEGGPSGRRTDGGEGPFGRTSPDDGDVARFERIDWEAIEGRRRPVRPERAVLAVGLFALSAITLYDRYVAGVYLVGTWNVTPVDWLFLLALVVLLAYGVVPAVRNRRAVRRVVRRLRSRPLAATSLSYLGLFILVGLFGPGLVGSPTLDPGVQYLPPVGETVPASATSDCLGGITGEGFDRICHGSWEHPLGTNHRGHDVVHLLVLGARTALTVSVVAVGLVVPLATLVGVAAATYGGWVDALLMAYVDLQLSVPALVIYFVFMFYLGPSLFLLLVVFGLLSWGGIARLVRSEVLQRREEGYVLVSRGAGASRAYVAKAHLLPNVTNTVVPAVFHLVPVLILTEAGIAFLGFEDARAYSWGETIADGLGQTVSAGSPADRFHNLAITPLEVWWVSAIPAALLALTLVAFKLAGDGIRDALDPRGER
ncbi:ABC transporter permease [Natronorarus salvus]|uniref:ABC transporter permease n=1 Tax=Natronorarus salvus TaxID=3117733 RepID=UPI002F26C12C